MSNSEKGAGPTNFGKHAGAACRQGLTFVGRKGIKKDGEKNEEKKMEKRENSF